VIQLFTNNFLTKTEKSISL